MPLMAKDRRRQKPKEPARQPTRQPAQETEAAAPSMANIPLLQQSLGNAGFARVLRTSEDAGGIPRPVRPEALSARLPAARPGATAAETKAASAPAASLLRTPALIHRAPPTNAPAAPAPAGPTPAPGPGGLLPANSFQPPADSKTTAIEWEGRLIADDFKLVNQTIDKAIEDLGWGGTVLWADRFIKKDPAGDAFYGDPKNVEYARKRLKDEMDNRTHQIEDLVGDTKFEVEGNEMGLGSFPRDALWNTNQLLDTSEKQLKEEAKHYGLKIESNYIVYKTYSTTAGGPLQAGLQAAAKALSMKRWQADKARAEFFKQQDLASDRPGLIAANVDPMEDARKKWVEEEEAYKVMCGEKFVDYPILAAYAKTDDAATQLTEIANQNTDDLAKSLYQAIDERLSNIATVRDEMGRRYSIWKQPQIIQLTKKTMGLPAWKARVVDEKVKHVKAEEKADKEFYQAIAIGIGMVGAIPTGGAAMAGSVALAGLVAAAGSMSAAYSMMQLYEHYKDYQLGSAAAETSMDPAQSIAKDAPGLLWLAEDLLDLGMNIVGAGAAFKSLHEAVELAKASKLAKLSEIYRVSGEVGLALETEGKLVAHAVQEAGGAPQVTATLGEIADVIKRVKIPANEKLQRGMQRIALQAITEGRVASVTTNDVNKMREEIGAMLSHRIRDPDELAIMTERYTNTFRDNKGVRGLYDPRYDVIVLRGDAGVEAVASTLVHETAHRQQELLMGLENLSVFEQEFQARVAQQQFLRGLPAGQVPVQFQKLWKASLQDIEAIVLKAYPGSFRPKGFNNSMSAEYILSVIRARAK